MSERKRKYKCPYCGLAQWRLPAGFEENPYCAKCLPERMRVARRKLKPLAPLDDLAVTLLNVYQREVGADLRHIPIDRFPILLRGFRAVAEVMSEAALVQLPRVQNVRRQADAIMAERAAYWDALRHDEPTRNEVAMRTVQLTPVEHGHDADGDEYLTLRIDPT